MSAITPRISDIPNGKNNYKVCNIVNFRGINCAENPLDIKLGEASDMKNLYVNDELSLTTRPRLGWVETLGDFSKILYDDGTILFGLDTSEDKKYKCWYRYKEKGEEKHKDCSFEDYSFDQDKWSIFKNSKGTYFLTCNKGYYYLDVSNYTFKNVIYSEEVYIPTTKIGKSFLDPNIGTEYEQRNLLSKKYKETYLFNLEETVVPSSFKNEKLTVNNVFDIKKVNQNHIYLNDFDLDNLPTDDTNIQKWVGKSPSGAYKVEVYKVYNSYGIVLTDYENSKHIKVLDNDLNEFVAYITTAFENPLTGVAVDIKPYFLIGLNANNEYVIYVIKTMIVTPESGDQYTIDRLSLWSFTVLEDKENNQYKLSAASRYYGDAPNKYFNGGLFDPLATSTGSVNLRFFLKKDDSKTIYFIDLHGRYGNSHKDIRSIDLINSTQGFEHYSDLFRTYDSSDNENLYNSIDYYDNKFFYIYKNNNYIIQNGILDSKTVGTKIQSILIDGSFYGVNINLEEDENFIEHRFINNGVLLVFTYKTFFLKINTSCLKNQPLNSQTDITGDIFNFKYDENLLEYENSLYRFTDFSKGYIYFLKDTIKNIIYYENKQYYLTSDITKRDPVNNIKLTLDSSQEFLGEEGYFNNKKIVLTTDTIETGQGATSTKTFITITYDPSAYKTLDVERFYIDEVDYSHDFSKVSIFDDKYWFYRSETEPNLIRYSYDTTGLYIPENNYDDIGDSAKITSVMQIADNYLGIFKENSAFTVTEDEETSDLYYVRTLKTELGNVPVGQTIVTSYSNNPLVINDYGIYGLGQNKNILETDSVFYSVTDKITSKYIKIKNKQNIKTHNHRFYTYFYYSEDNITKIWVLDNRFNAWYYWELPIPSIDYIYDKVYDLTNADEVLTYIWSGNKLYTLTTSYYGVLGNGNDSNFGASDIIGYQDYLNSDKGAYKRIEWYWKTPPLILQTINYLKKIVDMSMLFADAERETMYDSKHHKLIYGPGTDYRNNLELFYDIKTYRKKSMLLNGSYKGRIDYVSNARVKPRCQKCDFAALTLYNKIVKDDDNITYTYDNSNSDNDGYNNGYDIIDKLNLIGLTFKVVLS